METEIEAKFINIDKEKLCQKLIEKGAILEHPEILMRRKVYDYPDKRLNKIGGWVRVRDEGDKITLTYKQTNEKTLQGTKEISIIVNDFEKTCEFLEAIGMVEKSYQETKRERWKYKGVEITIDTWPWIPTFIELEGSNEEIVKEVAKDLELDWEKAIYGSVEAIYKIYYDVSEEEINSYPIIKFTDSPDWLLKRKRE
jgi:adenylate cyclase class 2